MNGTAPCQLILLTYILHTTDTRVIAVWLRLNHGEIEIWNEFRIHLLDFEHIFFLLGFKWKKIFGERKKAHKNVE